MRASLGEHFRVTARPAFPRRLDGEPRVESELAVTVNRLERGKTAAQRQDSTLNAPIEASRQPALRERARADRADYRSSTSRSLRQPETHTSMVRPPAFSRSLSRWSR